MSTPNPLAVTAWYDAPSRFLIMIIFMVWFGGFTFYGAVVIPTAHHVLGTHLEVGFLTQRVTHWLNLGGGITILALAVNLWLLKRNGVSDLRPLMVTWAMLILTLIGLLVLHQHLDQYLDEVEHVISKRTDFYAWHRIYLLFATIQWCAAIAHLWYVMARWRTLAILSYPSRSS